MIQTTNVGALPEKLNLGIGVSYRAHVSAWGENTSGPLTQSVRWRTNLLLGALLLVFSVVAAASGANEGREAQPVDSAPKNVSFSGGDGNGCDRAIVIRGAKGARDSVASEMAWLRAHYPGYKFRETTVQTRGQRSFEEVAIETAAGEKKVVCFDVSEGFGTL